MCCDGVASADGRAGDDDGLRLEALVGCGAKVMLARSSVSAFGASPGSLFLRVTLFRFRPGSFKQSRPR